MFTDLEQIMNHKDFQKIEITNNEDSEDDGVEPVFRWGVEILFDGSWYMGYSDNRVLATTKCICDLNEGLTGEE